MGWKFPLVAYLVGGFAVSGSALLIGVNVFLAFQFGFWLGGLGAGILAILYEHGRWPFTEPHDVF